MSDYKYFVPPAAAAAKKTKTATTTTKAAAAAAIENKTPIVLERPKEIPAWLWKWMAAWIQEPCEKRKSLEELVVKAASASIKEKKPTVIKFVTRRANQWLQKLHAGDLLNTLKTTSPNSSSTVVSCLQKTTTAQQPVSIHLQCNCERVQMLEGHIEELTGRIEILEKKQKLASGPDDQQEPVGSEEVKKRARKRPRSVHWANEQNHPDPVLFGLKGLLPSDPPAV
jgi:hypothetical protein